MSQKIRFTKIDFLVFAVDFVESDKARPLVPTTSTHSIMTTHQNQTIGRHDITGLILSGGQGKRMGVCDKGLQAFGEHCLALHVLQGLRNQGGNVAVNANQNLAQYERFGYPVWPDLHPDFCGPLAGVQTGLHHCHTRYLLTVPCDSPFLPNNLVGLLLQGLLEQDADLAIAVTEHRSTTDGQLLRQAHPVFCLLNCNLLSHLNAFLDSGGRKFSQWYGELKVAEVVFQDAQAFRNINTLEQLQAWQPPRAANTNHPSPPSNHAQHKATTMLASPSTRIHDYLHTLSDYQPHALSLSCAQKIIQAHCPPLHASEQVALRSALGRVLASDVCTAQAMPAHDNSAMDGYAFHSADLLLHPRLRLQIVGQALAGHPFTGNLERGQCVRIMTGAMLPMACDTVIAQEHVELRSAQEIEFATDGIKAGANRRKKGEDLACGEIAIAQGTRLQPAQLGMLASMGVAEVSVLRKLRVAFFSTGDELRSLGSELPAGCVYDSNRYSLFGMLTRLGCEVHDLGIVQDRPEAISQALANAASEADVVLTSGGMAGGDADFTRRIMQEMGDVHFWQMQMRPGRPFAFGRLLQHGHSTILFGLPGNPVALMISFYMLVRPALLQMMGQRDTHLPQLHVASTQAIRKMKGRAEFQRGILSQAANGDVQVSLTGAQGSAMLSSMSQANCILALPPEMGDVAVGEMVPVMLLDGLQ